MWGGSEKEKTYDEEEVDVVETQALQALLQALLDLVVANGVGGPQLGDDKDVLALDAVGESLLEAGTDLIFVGVAVGAVNGLVADGEGVGDGLCDLAGSGLPGALLLDRTSVVASGDSPARDE